VIGKGSQRRRVYGPTGRLCRERLAFRHQFHYRWRVRTEQEQTTSGNGQSRDAAGRLSLALGVACNHCLHRALLWPEDIGALAGKRVDDLRLKCSKCGQRDYETIVFDAQRDAKKFMAQYR
jgi:hypothetical protein